jgi:ATP-dependent Lon protease
MGQGGVIPIQCNYFPSEYFLQIKLTGMQGDVMKESMNVAKTLAWNLTNKDVQKKLSSAFDETKNQGIHVHCPEGSVSKDGPSAGAAITIAIYSLLNNKKIKRTIAITGEITLNGDITKIGGIELKITGGIRAGIKTFLYPTSNQKEIDECIEKYESLIKEKNIEFIAVSRIEDAINFVYQD